MRKLLISLLLPVLFITGNSGIAQVANFTVSGNANRCTNLNFTFTNSSTGATTYLWDFGDGSTSPAVNPTHAYSSGGNYMIRLTAFNGSLSHSVVKAIFVNGYPSVSFYRDGWGNVYTGTTCQFRNSSRDATGFLWDFGDGTFSSAVNPRKVYAQAGTFTVSLKALNFCGDTSTTTNMVLVADTSSIRPNASGYVYPDLACPNTTISFANYSSDFTTATWDFGNGQSLTTNKDVIDYEYPVKGVFEPRLIVYYKTYSDTQYFKVTITDTALQMPYNGVNPKFYLGGNYVVANCPGQPFQLYSGSANGISERYWRYNNTLLPGDEDTSIRFSVPGKYTLWFVAKTTCGAADSVKYELNVLPSDTFVNTLNPFTVNPYSGYVCPGDKFVFSFTAPGIAYTLQWFVNGTPAGTSDEITYITPGSPGPVNVKLYINPVCGAPDSMTRTLYSQSTTLASASFNSTFKTGEFNCYGDTVRFSGYDYSNTNPVTHLWDFGDGTKSTLESVNHKYGSTGWKTVLHEVTNTCGNKSYSMGSYYLVSNIPPVPRFELNESTICAGDSTGLNNYTFDADSAVIHFGDGQIRTFGYGFFPHLFHLYSNPGTYRPKLYVFNRCTMDSAFGELVVLDRPVTQILNPDTTVLLNASITFRKYTPEVSGFWWSLNPDGENPVSTETWTITFTKLGRNVVYLFTENANGCKNIDSVIVMVSSVGISEDYEALQTLEIYPNPFHDRIAVNLNLSAPARVQCGLYDLNGRLVQVLLDGSYKTGRHQTDQLVSGLNSGIYFCRTQVNNRLYYQKVVQF